ncbi:hypothetical protein [Mesorhizobium opportunistum]
MEVRQSSLIGDDCLTLDDEALGLIAFASSASGQYLAVQSKPFLV